MKKFFMGFIWFSGIWFATQMVCFILLGGMVVLRATQAGHPERASEEGKIATETFNEKYGSILMFSTLVVAIIGTATGALPGTKKRADTSSVISKTLPPPLPPGTIIMPKEIFVGRGTQKFGPFTSDEFRQMLIEGRLLVSDLAWYEGAEGWIPISKTPLYLMPLSPPNPASIPPPPPPQEAV